MYVDIYMHAHAYICTYMHACIYIHTCLHTHIDLIIHIHYSTPEPHQPAVVAVSVCPDHQVAASFVEVGESGYRGLQPWPIQTNNSKIDMWRFLAWHLALLE